MFEKNHILECLKNHYGIETTTLTCLPLGADINARIYKAQAKECSYFVKLKRGHGLDISVAILAMLQNAGIRQIISPVPTIQGNLTQHLDEHILSVFLFVEGQNGFTQALTDDQWITFGKVMGQVHELTIPASTQAIIRRETYSSQWRQTVRSLYPLIEAEDEITVQLLSFMQKNASLIHTLVDRAEQLAQQVQSHSSEFVLCHGDLHAGNILITEDGTFYIVDWDDPIMAPKERDLMFIGGGVGNVWNNPLEEACFYQGYGRTSVNMDLLAYYRFERIIEDIAVYCQEILFPSAGGHNRVQLYKEFMAQFEPKGVVEIALK